MKIAIIGSGISGIGCAYFLNPHHQITLFEKNDYVGGHANTALIEYPLDNSLHKIAVDTGFIVYNFKTYHNLKPFFEELKVPIVKSQMSFGVSIENGLEYSGQSLNGLFTQRQNLFKPKFLKMLLDIYQFNCQAIKLVEGDGIEEITLNQFIKQLKLGKYFEQYYLFPMAAAIWSCPAEIMKNYPAKSFLRFFYNHGLLSISNQPQWYSIKGGSREYIKRAIAGFDDKIKLNCGVKKVYQNADKSLSLIDENDQQHQFDKIIFACNGDQVLPILSDATASEKAIFDKFKSSKNIAILHRDPSQMPKIKKAWSSWNYLLDEQKYSMTDLEHNQQNKISLTYWMNNLQNIDPKFPLFVTLNPTSEIKPELTFAKYQYSHPIFDKESVIAAQKMPEIQGLRNLYFCGAYGGYGFHEDGLLSALKVVNHLGIKAKWQN